MNELDLDAQDMKNILEALVKEPYFKVARTVQKLELALQPKENNNAQLPP